MIIPKSIAPRLIKFAQTPNTFIRMKAKSSDNGIVEATIKPPRQLPNKNTNTKITISAPSIKFWLTVLVVLAINVLRSKNGSIVTPLGSDFCISATRFCTASITSLELAPLSIRTIPPATSPLPSLVNDPYLTALPN